MAATAAARRAVAERARTGPAAPRRARARRAPRRQSRTRTRATATRRRGITPATGLQIPVAVGQRTAVAVGGLADSGVVHRLTRGRLWILLLAALLAGIVALNVLSLSFSASASRVAAQADAIQRENSVLRARLASDVSSQQVQAAGERAGLLMPAPGAIDYLRPSGDDAEIAAKRLLDGELTATAPVAETEVVAPVEPVEPVVTDVLAPVEPATPVESSTPVEPVAEAPVTDPAAAPVTDAGAIPAP
jgi:hypothetical protein